MCDSCEWEDALERCENLLAQVEDLPDRASDFAASLQERIGGIQSWVEENHHVTDRQVQALDNMEAGIEKWTKRNG